MTSGLEEDRLEAIIDAYEVSVLEAGDNDILATGDGSSAARIVARALGARHYQADGNRSVVPRERLRRGSATTRARAPLYDVTKVRARFSSSSDEALTERDDDDPDIG